MDKQSSNVAFKVKHNLEQRKRLYQDQISKTPEMIPLILQKDPRSKIDPLEKKKYLANGKYTLFHFLETVKKMFANRIKKSESLCFYVAGKVIENGEKLMEDVYRAHHDEDGFLYVTYGTLEAF